MDDTLPKMRNIRSNIIINGESIPYIEQPLPMFWSKYHSFKSFFGKLGAHLRSNIFYGN